MSRAVRVATADTRLSKLRRAVQAARRARGLDEDAYRSMLEAVTGRRSSTECTTAELMRLLDVLNGKDRAATRSRPAAEGAIPAKVRALVLNLHALGAWPHPSEAEIGKFVRRQAGVDDLRFLTPASMTSVVEALRAMCAREGLVLRPGVSPAEAEVALVQAQVQKLRAVDPASATAFEPAVTAIETASEAHRRRLVRSLGEVIRGRQP
ncbi:regulatory protein GemA [Segnochrobactrum spirostomi]|uniref:Regulatory protein GemA n=1 Tax=Segnochrobactrum spirostomi TaxID=2608987 RepID=A0A6A7Y3H1_9HYPH|nr:regulatory protein GemA [Segnochrobactrum spirostomi]MQT13664.1 regulatory protein GemA [Segnochrobactrum spirostomi]